MHNCNLFLWRYVTATIFVVLFPSKLIADEGVEVRAARVCAGLAKYDGNFQGGFKLGDVSVQGDSNGTVHITKDEADLGKMEKGTYAQYVSCLTQVIVLISRPPTAEYLPQPHATQTSKVCVGNGGGPSCAIGSAAYYTCAQFDDISGHGRWTNEALGKQFCQYTDAGVTILAPYKVIRNFNVSGGQCGWTGFTVTCNP